MAASDARPVPRKNVAYRVTFPILDADGDLVTGAASLDSEVSIDGAAFADCTNEATEIATSSGVYYLELTASEMNGDTVAVIVKTGTAGAKTTTIVMYPEEAGDYRTDVTHFGGTAGTFSSGRPEVNTTHISGDSGAADNAEAFFDGTGYAGTNNVIPTVTTLTNGVTVTTNNDKTGYRLSATGVDDILDEAVEGSSTLRQYMRGVFSALMGKSSGHGSGSPAYRDAADSKDRISATTDADGNRTAVTVDLT